MDNILGAMVFNDVVWLSIANDLFWLAVVGAVTFLCARVFRSEISAVLGSLTSFSVAGTHFDLRDKSLAMKSYSILSNIFLDLLSDSAKREQLVGVFSEVNAQQLSRFTMKYLLEAKDEINYPLVRNIAYISGRRAGALDALSLYDLLIKNAPNDLYLRHEKGLFLLDLNPGEAKKLYGELINENPGFLQARYNYAICNIMLDDFDDGFKSLEHAIMGGYIDNDMEKRPGIQKLARARPDLAKKLLDLIKEPELHQKLTSLIEVQNVPNME